MTLSKTCIGFIVYSTDKLCLGNGLYDRVGWSIALYDSQKEALSFVKQALKGYKVKIDYGNGKGLVATTCSGLICSLSSNALPVGASSANYKIGIYDSKGILLGTTKDGTYAIKSILSTILNTK